MKENYYIMIIALLTATNLGCYFFVFKQKKELKAKYFKQGIKHAYLHFENQMKMGKIQHRKLLSLFNVMKKEALQKYGD